MSLSSDSVVKIWDLRTQGCLQTISPLDWSQPEDANPTAMSFDSARKRLVSIKHRPAVWIQKCVSDLSSSHETPLVGALVNSAFDMVSLVVTLLCSASMTWAIPVMPRLLQNASFQQCELAVGSCVLALIAAKLQRQLHEAISWQCHSVSSAKRMTHAAG